MTPEETFDLLTLMATRDNRTIGKVDVIAWQEDVGDLDFTDACAAVSLHFRQSTDWLMPKHIRDLVKKIRAERLDGFQYVPVPGDDDPKVYLANLRAQRAAVADGRRPAAPSALPPSDQRAEAVRELVAGVFPEPPKTDAKPGPQRAETAEETKARELNEAYGYLLTINDDARHKAIEAAHAQIGSDAERRDVVLLAAKLANAQPEPARPDKATADRVAAQGCPNGCPLGAHVEPCHFAEAS